MGTWHSVEFYTNRSHENFILCSLRDKINNDSEFLNCCESEFSGLSNPEIVSIEFEFTSKYASVFIKTYHRESNSVNTIRYSVC